MAIKLDCSACKTDKTMTATKVARFSMIVRVIGYLIVVPSLLGLAFAFTTCSATTNAASDVMARTATDAGKAGAAVGAGIGYGISVFIGVSSLVSGLVGWLLSLQRKVFRCLRCGFILDRA